MPEAKGGEWVMLVNLKKQHTPEPSTFHDAIYNVRFEADWHYRTWQVKREAQSASTILAKDAAFGDREI